MKKWISLLFCLSLLCFAFAAVAEGTAITVKGSATVTAEPDQCTITAGVTCTDETVTGAQQQLSENIASVKNALISIGLTEDEITTSDYSCYPNYDYSGDTPVISGYTASHTLAVACKDLTNLDAVVSAVSSHGATEIYSLNFDIADKTELYAQALTEAVSAATAKAKILSAAMSLSSITPVSVTENSVGSVGYSVKAVASNADASSDSISTGINAGSVSVSATIEMVFSAE